MVRYLIALAMAWSALGCRANNPPEAPAERVIPAPAAVDEAMVRVSAADGLNAALDRPVRVSGIAGQAKLGAVVLLGDEPVYCLGLTAWPEARSGGPVTVEGRLRRREPSPAVGGVASAGVTGPIWQVEGCRSSDR